MAIELLDELTINKIAAGEVIERPASALKELLENSADGGATRIEVDFEAGGKNYLKVKDDGFGIPMAELPLALARHATSKIKKIDDLSHLNTFGFRGEALSSLSAVSEMSLHSGSKSEKVGGKLIAQGGKIEGPAPASPLAGTEVVVKNLFFNVPARQKFLKSDAAETSALKKTAKAFALGHPEITLTLKQSGKVIEHWPAQDFFKRACHILGLPPSGAIHLKNDEGEFKIEALLGLPENHLSTQQGIWIFVQGRHVIDRTIQQACIEGYRNLLMHQQYPQVVIHLRTDPINVDVNVHPAKSQVKFANPSRVFKFVADSISGALARRLETERRQSAQALFPAEDAKALQAEFVQEAVTLYNKRVLETPVSSGQRSFSPPPSHAEQSKSDVSDSVSPSANQESGAWSSLALIGQFANTYIVTQSPASLVLVDQHAAHERVLFERIKRNFQTGGAERQMSLLEELIELEPEGVEALTQDRILEAFDKIGFTLSRRGSSTLGVSARPALLLDAKLKPLFERLAEQITEMGSHGALEDMVGDLWASMACHGAIRAGRVLSPDEMQTLLNQMDEFAFSSFCPHGRPVSVKLGLSELERLFKRIV